MVAAGVRCEKARTMQGPRVGRGQGCRGPAPARARRGSLLRVRGHGGPGNPGGHGSTRLGQRGCRAPRPTPAPPAASRPAPRGACRPGGRARAGGGGHGRAGQGSRGDPAGQPARTGGRGAGHPGRPPGRRPGTGAGPRARSRAGGRPGQGRVPGQHEPRDPHPDPCHHREHRAAARDPPGRGAEGIRRHRAGLGRGAARAGQRHPGHLAHRGGEAPAGNDRLLPPRCHRDRRGPQCPGGAQERPGAGHLPPGAHADPDQGRSRAPAPGAREPAQQRGEVHARWRGSGLRLGPARG